MRAKRVDANQPEIVAVLRGEGLSVLHLHEAGKGIPDLACGFGGLCALVEIKTETGKRTKAQNEMMKWWTGGVYLVRNAQDALRFAQTMKRYAGFINQGIAAELH